MTEYKARKRPVLNNIVLTQPEVNFENNQNVSIKNQNKISKNSKETLSSLLSIPDADVDDVVKNSLSLSDLLNDLKDVIDDTLYEEVWITAEIAKLKQQGKYGHIYLELIDRNEYGNELSKINAKIWSSNTDKIINKFEKNTNEALKDGIKCEWLVKIDYNIKFGLSLTISDIKPLWTIGEHEKKKEDIRIKLKENNLWFNQNKLKTPDVITNIAIVAPQEAAGLGDFISEANKWKSSGIINVDVVYAIFEGEKTSSSIQDALIEIKKKEDIFFENNNSPLYDLIIILRGGGAKTSLAWLDDYGILYQILTNKTPIWSAIGHEQDNGLIDEVSSLSLHTPSKAAQRIWDMLQKEYYDFNQSFSYITNEREKRTNRIEDNIKNITDNIVYEAYQRIDNLKKRTIDLSREAISLGPQATLERGYAIIKDSDNNIIKNASDMKNKNEIKIMWHDSIKEIFFKEKYND